MKERLVKFFNRRLRKKDRIDFNEAQKQREQTLIYLYDATELLGETDISVKTNYGFDRYVFDKLKYYKSLKLTNKKKDSTKNYCLSLCNGKDNSRYLLISDYMLEKGTERTIIFKEIHDQTYSLVSADKCEKTDYKTRKQFTKGRIMSYDEQKEFLDEVDQAAINSKLSFGTVHSPRAQALPPSEN